MKPPAPVTNAQGFIAFDILTSPSRTFGVQTGHVTADVGALKRQEGVARLLTVSVRQAAPTGRHCANGKRALSDAGEGRSFGWCRCATCLVSPARRPIANHWCR